MTQTKPPSLKYYFEVLYTDGTRYIQNEEDISIGEDKTKSCYSDVILHQELGRKIKTFFLFDNETIYSVNLIDGHFEVNKTPFYLHRETDVLKEFELIYYRTNKVSQDFKAVVGDDLIPNMEEAVGPQRVVTSFNFGWRSKDPKGNVREQVIEIY